MGFAAAVKVSLGVRAVRIDVREAFKRLKHKSLLVSECV